MADSLGEVVGAGKWEKALFTTFSLSLTFFESVLLRALRKADCREVWVVADADGYRSSLMERGSSGVGSEYHLVPIGLPNGVFHAKCCYLVGSEGDLLAIGSGNLTFGGFGRNLEVLDVLESQTHQQCFFAFADFLTALKNRADILCPDFRWAEMFADRAYEVGTNSSQVLEHPKLITSVEQSIKGQLGELVASSEAVENLTILSPFFDPNGQAVLDLAIEIKAREVRIALSPGNALSSFPFPKASRWPIKFSTVRLHREQENRPLHAKWVECKTTKGIFALTGSVNATKQALCGTENIEVGVLRFDPSNHGWATWQEVPIPSSYQAHTFKRSGMGATHLVFAELTESGELRGRIISLLSTGGMWAGKVQKSNGDSVDVQITVRSDGQFSHFISGGEDFLLANGLQIILERGSTIARGWITNATLLSLPKTQRIPLSSILRLINREETEEDDLVLLEYLVVHATDHLRVFQSRVTAAREYPEAPSDEQEAFSIDLKDLEPQAHESHPNSVSSDPITSAGFALERVFAQLRKRLVGHLPGRQRTGSRAVSDDANEEQVAGEDALKRTRLEERFESAFDCFMEGMQKLVNEPTMAKEHRRALLVLWLEVALHMLVRRKRDRAEGVAFMHRWFLLATSLTSSDENADGLEQHIVTCAAILFACNSASEDIGRLLHEALEHYWRGAVNRERAVGALLPHSRLSIAGLFLEPSSTMLRNNLEMILNTPTVRCELETVLSKAQNGDTLPKDLRLFQSAAGKELRDELKARGLSKRIEVLGKNDFTCPSQFIRLSEVCKGQLQKHRVARCSVCGSLIVRSAP
jgi:hypothetical protein